MIAAALFACALNVAPATLEAVIRVESGGDELALHVNGLTRQPPRGRDANDVAGTAEDFIRRGYSVDLGLMQVNSRNLPALGLTISVVLEPCANIRAGAAILAADYAIAVRMKGAGQPALLAALSAYNSGDFARGFANGYVARFVGAAPSPLIPAPARRQTSPDPAAADTAVYTREASHVRID